jgi:hypothetical protein
MRNQPFIALFVSIGSMTVALPPVAAQEPPAIDRSAVPCLADGRPDLQGVWDFRSNVPFERRDEDRARAAAQAAVQQREEARADGRVRDEDLEEYNRFWYDDRVTNQDERTSLIVDPPNGKLPRLVPDTERQVGSYKRAHLPAERPIRYRGGGAYPNGPEDRGLAERCILGFNSGPPIRPGGYNQNLQVFQTSDYVVIYNEMVHNARVVPLDGRPHLPDDIRQWTGDSRGYWSGDTLIIESTNFSDKVAGFDASATSALGNGRALHLTERLRRLDAITLEYEVTVTHPEVFRRPFTAMIPMTKSGLQIFEYACHEGNYALTQILSGTRMEELNASQENE